MVKIACYPNDTTIAGLRKKAGELMTAAYGHTGLRSATNAGPLVFRLHLNAVGGQLVVEYVAGSHGLFLVRTVTAKPGDHYREVVEYGDHGATSVTLTAELEYILDYTQPVTGHAYQALSDVLERLVLTGFGGWDDVMMEATRAVRPRRKATTKATLATV